MAFQIIYNEPDGIRTLLKAYQRQHLVPIGAVEVLEKIFVPQQSRYGADQILELPWMKEAASSMKHFVARRKSTLWYKKYGEMH